MYRRVFLTGCLFASTTVGAYFPVLAETAKVTAKKARIIENRLINSNRPYNYRKITDPTGSAPTKQIERFELRGGDCPSKGDCTPRALNGRMVTRARTERVMMADLRDGDEGIISYSAFIPSAEFNFTHFFGTTMGQILSRLSRDSNSDGFPIFSMNTDEIRGSAGLIAVLNPARDFESQEIRERHFKLNKGKSSSLIDNWFKVEIRFVLSSDTDGVLDVSVNGRRIGTFEGRTIVPDGYLEFRYGIYQTGTNQYPGGAGALPPQVVYFSNVRILKIN